MNKFKKLLRIVFGRYLYDTPSLRKKEDLEIYENYTSECGGWGEYYWFTISKKEYYIKLAKYIQYKKQEKQRIEKEYKKALKILER